MRWRRGSSDRHGAPVVSLDANRWVALTNVTLVGFMSRRPRRRRRVRSSRARARRAGGRLLQGQGLRQSDRVAAGCSCKPNAAAIPRSWFHEPREESEMHAPIVMRSARKTSGPTVAHPSPPTAAATRIRSGVATAFAHRHTSATCHPTTAFAARAAHSGRAHWRPNVISRRRGANRERGSGPAPHPPSPRLQPRKCDRAASRDGVTAMPRIQSFKCQGAGGPGRVNPAAHSATPVRKIGQPISVRQARSSLVSWLPTR